MDGDEFFEKARAFFPHVKDWPPENQRRVLTSEEFKEFSSRSKSSIEGLSKSNDSKKEHIVGGDGEPISP